MHTGLAASPHVPDGGTVGPTAVRRRLCAEHGETVAAVVDAADAVADGLAEPPRESAAITDPLAAELRERSLEEPLLAALSDAAALVGDGLPHEPSAAPPYLTVTSRGPVLRATLDAGRLVIVVGVFAVERDDGPRYVRSGDDADSVLRVELHGDGDGDRDPAVAGPGDDTETDGHAGRGASPGDGDDGGEP